MIVTSYTGRDFRTFTKGHEAGWREAGTNPHTSDAKLAAIWDEGYAAGRAEWKAFKA